MKRIFAQGIGLLKLWASSLSFIQVRDLRRTALNRYYVDFLRILMNFHLRPL